MKSTLDLAQKFDAGLSIELSGHQVKFRIDEDVWRAGIEFSTALERLRARLLPD
jgi:hypothetical protein